MKKNTHPKLFKITASCSCNKKIHIFSTIKKNINIDVCNNCHSFYTNKQKFLNKKGRIENFKKKFNIPKIKI